MPDPVVSGREPSGFLVFLDRDGTIIENRNYLSDPESVSLLPGAAEGLRRIQALDGRLVLSQISPESVANILIDRRPTR